MTTKSEHLLEMWCWLYFICSLHCVCVCVSVCVGRTAT